MQKLLFLKYEAYKVASMSVHAAALVWQNRTWVGPNVAKELRTIADNLDSIAEGIREEIRKKEDNNG